MKKISFKIVNFLIFMSSSALNAQSLKVLSENINSYEHEFVSNPNGFIEKSLLRLTPIIDNNDKTSGELCSRVMPTQEWDKCFGSVRIDNVAVNSIATYTGYFREGLPNGDGKLVNQVGEIYEGKFYSGRFLPNLKSMERCWTIVDKKNKSGSIVDKEVHSGIFFGTLTVPIKDKKIKVSEKCAQISYISSRNKPYVPNDAQAFFSEELSFSYEYQNKLNINALMKEGVSSNWPKNYYNFGYVLPVNSPRDCRVINDIVDIKYVKNFNNCYLRFRTLGLKERFDIYTDVSLFYKNGFFAGEYEKETQALGFDESIVVVAPEGESGFVTWHKSGNVGEKFLYRLGHVSDGMENGRWLIRQCFNEPVIYVDYPLSGYDRTRMDQSYQACRAAEASIGKMFENARLRVNQIGGPFILVP